MEADLEVRVQLGRIEERLIALGTALRDHIQEEDNNLRETLMKIAQLESVVDSLERAIGEIHTLGKITRVLAAIVVTLGGAVAWGLDWFKRS